MCIIIIQFALCLFEFIHSSVEFLSLGEWEVIKCNLNVINLFDVCFLFGQFSSQFSVYGLRHFWRCQIFDVQAAPEPETQGNWSMRWSRWTFPHSLRVHSNSYISNYPSRNIKFFTRDRNFQSTTKEKNHLVLAINFLSTQLNPSTIRQHKTTANGNWIQQHEKCLRK